MIIFEKVTLFKGEFEKEFVEWGETYRIVSTIKLFFKNDDGMSICGAKEKVKRSEFNSWNDVNRRMLISTFYGWKKFPSFNITLIKYH